MFQRVLQSREQPAVFGVIIGLMPEIFAEHREAMTGLISDDHAESCGPRIPPCTAIYVRNQV